MHDTLNRLTARPDVNALLETIAIAQILESAIAVQQIPAPTFHESARASFVHNRMASMGLADVGKDEIDNVYGRIRGSKPGAPALLISAHSDTVFAADTDLSIKRAGDRVYGPGLGDNSLGVAAVLELAEAMCTNGYRPPCDLWFVANVREEGLGDLGGIKAVLQRLKEQIGAAVVIEGMTLGRIYHGGIAVRRFKITCKTPGGHSWGHFGRPSAIHHLMRLGTRITEMPIAQKPRSTYNIGLVEGGESINTIAPEAALYLDLRAETTEGVAALVRQVKDVIATEAACAAELQITTEMVGNRPAGAIPAGHWLVQAANVALAAVGIEPVYGVGSTDVNAVLAMGLPGVCIGITRGANAHRQDEYIEIAPLAAGMKQLTLLVLLILDQLKQTKF